MVRHKYTSYKDYAGRYGISTVKYKMRNGKEIGVQKSVNELLNDIYEYEMKKRPKDALYPFFRG